MITPNSRSEFERNFFLLEKKIMEGKLHIEQSLRYSIGGLEKVRYLPNGRIDFLSVDESARLLANQMANFDLDCMKPMIHQETDSEESANISDNSEVDLGET